MEVTLVHRSIYALPSNQRVGCIVYDGAADMQLWPGPGPDLELTEHYGDTLQRALDTELRQIEGRLLPIPSIVRVHPGRLHCNFLAWAATRPPEPGTDRTPAPSAEVIQQTVLEALRFAAQRSVERIAFPALGAGPGELPRAERLAIVVRAAHAYQDECTKAGRAPVVEEVLVCEAGVAFREAKQKVAHLARAEEREARAAAAPPKASAPKKAASSGGGGGRSRAAGPVKHRAPALTSDEIARVKGSGERYDMRRTYGEGDFFVHPKFGVGKVVSLPEAHQMNCVFEDGSERKLVHARG
jgi:O-acetyl-ADP-ribose deacetylase (regulator of RNase III)